MTTRQDAQALGIVKLKEEMAIDDRRRAMGRLKAAVILATGAALCVGAMNAWAIGSAWAERQWSSFLDSQIRAKVIEEGHSGLSERAKDAALLVANRELERRDELIRRLGDDLQTECAILANEGQRKS